MKNFIYTKTADFLIRLLFCKQSTEVQKRIRAMSEKIFSDGEIVNRRVSNELVTILKSHYVKNMNYNY